MKAHSVKSNAKREARKFCAENPAFEPAEPHATDCSKSAWFPVVTYLGSMANHACRAVARAEAKGLEGRFIVVDRDGKRIETAEPAPVAAPKPMKLADMKAAVADMPPTKSTPEEIAARRAARRERIAEAKANPPPPKQTKVHDALRMLERPEGATGAQLQAAFGWLPHTVRGFLSTLKSKGQPITTTKNGKVTTYRIIRDAA